MFIVWGTKVGRKRHGRWADYCLFCREARPCRVSAVYSQRHVYWIPTSRREYLAFEATCEQCGGTTQHDWSPDRAISKDRDVPLAQLLAQTYPGHEQVLEARSELERRAKRGRLSPAERDALAKELFFALEPLLKPRTQAAHVDIWAAWTIFAGVFGSFALLILIAIVSATSKTTIPLWLFLGYAGTCFVMLIYLLATDARRYFRSKLLPLLGRGLRSLRLSLEDLERVIADLRRHQLAIARYAKPAKVMAEIERFQG